MKQKREHEPVLCREIVDLFANHQLHRFVDGTLGGAGHASEMIRVHPEMELLIGIDQDPDARALAERQLAPYADRVRLVAGNFRDLQRHLQRLSVDKVDGLLVDLGVSSMQLDRAEKGFSFSHEGPLDMRMDPQSRCTAAEIVNSWSEEELGKILREYAELPNWRSVAREIVAQRAKGAFSTTTDLATRLRPALRRGPKRKIDPSTLLFQALRIAVNDELGALETFLPQTLEVLRPGGIVAVISFHSLEDGIVKRFFRTASADRISDPTHPMGHLKQVPKLRLLTRKPISASDEEVQRNPRSRSARLRAAERV